MRNIIEFLSTTDSWFVIAAAIFLLAVVIHLSARVVRLYNNIRARTKDPLSYPAMIPGGLSDDPQMAYRQIVKHYPGRHFKKGNGVEVAIGHFKEHPIDFRLQMAFGDGRIREVGVFGGFAFCRVSTSTGVEFYHCLTGGLLLPHHVTTGGGWNFDVKRSWSSPQKK